jgi:hypothetical protein
MNNTQEIVQISMSFHFLEESYVAKMVFLLQVDNYDSYKLVNDFEKYIELLKNSMDFKVHYKVFKNTPLDSSGYVSTEDPSTKKNVVYIGNNYYFVVKNNSFEKSDALFFETLRQICLYENSENGYFNYMKEIGRTCFQGPDPKGNFDAVQDFTGCTDNIYNSIIQGKNEQTDKVSEELTKENERMHESRRVCCTFAFRS